jgi:hypothetical protein
MASMYVLDASSENYGSFDRWGVAAYGSSSLKTAVQCVQLGSSGSVSNDEIKYSTTYMQSRWQHPLLTDQREGSKRESFPWSPAQRRVCYLVLSKQRGTSSAQVSGLFFRLRVCDKRHPTP